jgi:hypothetical protein
VRGPASGGRRLSPLSYTTNGKNKASIRDTLSALVLAKSVVAAARLLEGLLMEKKRNLFATIMAGLFLLPAAGSLSAEVICGKEPRLKPVRCVCGKLIDPTGGPVSAVIVKVLKDGTEVATMVTAGDGKFIFGELKSGNYELNAQADGFRMFRSPIVVAKPAKKCRRGLVILLDTGGLESCGSRVIKQ